MSRAAGLPGWPPVVLAAFAEIECLLIVALPTAQGGGNAGNERPDHQREGAEQREGGASLAGRIGGLLGLDLRIIDLSEHGIDTGRRIRLREAGADSDELAEIGLVRCRDLAGGGAGDQDA